MKKLLLTLVSVSFFVLSCENNAAEPGEENASANCIEKSWKEDVVCTMQYDPVCGCNNKTYSNACHAGAYGVAIAYTGECRK